jgi:hypothetical protein
MSRLMFKRRELEGEVDAMRSIAKPFLDAQTQWRLDDVFRQLRHAPRRAPLVWNVPKDAPLMTTQSEGEYEQGARHGGHDVVGSLSFSWDLRLDGEVAELSGNATTRFILGDSRYGTGDAAHHLGVWRMEVGVEDSPGACFHTQVVGDEVGPPLPPSLPIPRLPTFVPTPMAVLEFMLGELFQDRWKQAVGMGATGALTWRNLQRGRWKAFLAWQQEQVREGTPSPWTALKRFPPPDVFAAT